jgi:hypothetical protein
VLGDLSTRSGEQRTPGGHRIPTTRRPLGGVGAGDVHFSGLLPRICPVDDRG